MAPAFAQGEPEALKEDNVHVRTWNEFADDLLTIHKAHIDAHPTEKKSRLGGYMGMPEFYLEETHYHAATGQVLSRVQWERENPQLMHSIEVFVYGDDGQLKRDYTAAYLPNYRNAPTQTLITFYNHDGELQGLRSFDASGYRVFERCEGRYQGEDVFFMLDEGEIHEAKREKSSIMYTDLYKTCFAGLPETAEGHLSPTLE
jgi:hypothetical protein